MRKTAFITIVLIVFSITLTACKQEELSIVIIPKLTSISYYDVVYQGVKEGVPFTAGRLGEFIPVRDGISLQVSLPLLRFTNENIDKYNF